MAWRPRRDLTCRATCLVPAFAATASISFSPLACAQSFDLIAPEKMAETSGSGGIVARPGARLLLHHHRASSPGGPQALDAARGGARRRAGAAAPSARPGASLPLRRTADRHCLDFPQRRAGYRGRSFPRHRRPGRPPGPRLRLVARAKGGAAARILRRTFAPARRSLPHAAGEPCGPSPRSRRPAGRRPRRHAHSRRFRR